MKTELEKCLAGEPFNGGDKVLADMTLNAKRLLKRLNETDYADTEQRKRIFHDLFGKMGEHVHIDIDFHCEYGKHIFIGDQVIINMNCTFLDDNIIKIGNNVLIAPNVQLYTATHPINANERFVNDWDERSGDLFFRTKALPITIEDNVWIGGGTIVLPGITIGRNSVIGAGSVVTKSIPTYSVAVGNPCRVIRELPKEDL